MLTRLSDQGLRQVLTHLAIGAIIGVTVVALAVVGGEIALVALGVLLVGAGLIAIVGAERLFVGLIILNLPLQVDVHLWWREEEGGLSALAGLPLSVTTIAVLGLLVWRLLAGLTLAPWDSLRGHWPRRAWLGLGAFVVLSAGSVLVAEDVAFASYELALFVQSVLLLGYLASALRRGDLGWVVTLLLVGVIVEGAIMLAQTLGVVSIGAEVWTSGAGLRVVQRAGGMLGSPNSAATYLSVIGPIALSAVVDAWRPARSVVALAALTASAGGLALTLSRGGLLAFGVGVGVFVVAGIHRRLVATGPLLAVGAVLTVIAVAAGNSLLLRIADDYGAASGRIGLLKIGWRMLSSSPLTGVGLNNYAIVLPEYLTPEFSDAWINVVHNYYLLIAAESGVFALVAFVAFLGAAAAALWVASESGLRSEALLALGMLGALAARAVHMFFDIFNGPLQWDVMIVVVAFAFALHDRHLERVATERADGTASPPAASASARPSRR